MKIVLATPLYPPESGGPAMYIKELARRLSGRNRVSIVAYANWPEQIEGVAIVSVSKRSLLPWRLVAYFAALSRAARTADYIYAENGASVELPAPLVSFIFGRKLILHRGDQAAHARAKNHPVLGLIERLAGTRAQTVITDIPLARPEILPFGPRPEEDLRAFERSWQEHLKQLEAIFTHA